MPVVTPFLDTPERPVDHEALAKQVVRIAKAGLGVVVLGTNGEASHLADKERYDVIVTARKALDENGMAATPLVAGTGGGSMQSTISLCRDAAQAGASHALVICPGYFAFAMKGDREAIKDFFRGVMDKSPLPVMIYNFPGAAAGIDLDSDEISELAEHPNCFGVKLTCAMIGKGQRIATYTQSAEFVAKRRSQLQSITGSGQFLVLPGFSESLLPALIARQHGCITGTGNLFPKTMRKLYETSLAAIKGEDPAAWSKALELQDRVAASDYTIVKAGIPGTKYAMDKFVEQGLGGVCRSPIGRVSEKVKSMVDKDLQAHWDFEKSL